MDHVPAASPPVGGGVTIPAPAKLPLDGDVGRSG